MPIEEITKLINDIENGLLITESIFQIDIDQALNERDDTESFESEWLRIDRELGEFEITREEKESLDKLRELVFMRTIRVSNHSEAAGYVSDDFGLIGKALIVNFDDEWLNALCNEYKNHRFPRPGQ